MTSKERNRRFDTHGPMLVPLVDHMPYVGEHARRMLSKTVGSHLAADALARIERELDQGAGAARRTTSAGAQAVGRRQRPGAKRNTQRVAGRSR